MTKKERIINKRRRKQPQKIKNDYKALSLDDLNSEIDLNDINTINSLSILKKENYNLITSNDGKEILEVNYIFLDENKNKMNRIFKGFDLNLNDYSKIEKLKTKILKEFLILTSNHSQSFDYGSLNQKYDLDYYDSINYINEPIDYILYNKDNKCIFRILNKLCDILDNENILESINKNQIQWIYACLSSIKLPIYDIQQSDLYRLNKIIKSSLVNYTNKHSINIINNTNTDDIVLYEMLICYIILSFHYNQIVFN